MWKLTLLPILGALAFVLLYGAAGVGRETERKLHDLRNPDSCVKCHPREDMTSLRQAEPGLCLACHEDELNHGFSHPLGVAVVRNGDPGLPLADGRLSCSTCHDPHDKTDHDALLRRTGNALCAPCHRDQAGGEGHAR